MSQERFPSGTENRAIDWNRGAVSELVDIGTHRLHLSAAGTSREPGSPVVIIISGLANSITGWAAVIRHIARKWRVYSYDRTGYGKSDTSLEAPTSTRIAHELDLLLRNAGIEPPYLIVAHSWGGVLSREFISLRPQKDIYGMVFVDANQEHTLERLDWRKLINSPVLTGVDLAKATGHIIFHEPRNKEREMQGDYNELLSDKFTKKEWERWKATEASEKHQKQAKLEYEQYENSFPVLAAKNQLEQKPPYLGDIPVCVIKGDNGQDFYKMGRAGIDMGNGTEQEREAYMNVVRSWNENDWWLQKGILKLSRVNRYVEYPDSGHDLQLTAALTILDGVRWVMDPDHFE